MKTTYVTDESCKSASLSPTVASQDLYQQGLGGKGFDF